MVKLSAYQEQVIGKAVPTQKPDRRYPSFYEKVVPILIAILGLVVLGMLVFTIAVGVGLIRFG